MISRSVLWLCQRGCRLRNQRESPATGATIPSSCTVQVAELINRQLFINSVSNELPGWCRSVLVVMVEVFVSMVHHLRIHGPCGLTRITCDLAHTDSKALKTPLVAGSA